MVWLAVVIFFLIQLYRTACLHLHIRMVGIGHLNNNPEHYTCMLSLWWMILAKITHLASVKTGNLE